jgi:hypothetical protein
LGTSLGKLNFLQCPHNTKPDELCSRNKHWKDSLRNLVCATKRGLQIPMNYVYATRRGTHRGHIPTTLVYEIWRESHIPIDLRDRQRARVLDTSTCDRCCNGSVLLYHQACWPCQTQSNVLETSKVAHNFSKSSCICSLTCSSLQSSATPVHQLNHLAPRARSESEQLYQHLDDCCIWRCYSPSGVSAWERWCWPHRPPT